MTEPIIEARSLGIKFAKSRRRKLSVRELFVHGDKRRPSGDFWPLRDISFDIQPGEAVGVVGRNGTGKSTLLKMVAGVLIPDKGTVTVHGKVAPLLELRAGFNEELTGRENVHLLASLHGMKSSEIEKQFADIVRFAEVEEFIDMPLRHYSSGMKVRLGFAVIAQLSHPVLLVDEVLAVGDKEFKKKCYATIEKMLADGRTLLLVSHNERDLQRFCTRGLYIRDGKLVVDGTLDEALGAYNSDTDGPAPKKAKKPAKKPAAKKPAVKKPDAEPKPDVSKSDAEPEAPKPDAKSDTEPKSDAKSDVSKSDAEPDAPKPDAKSDTEPKSDAKSDVSKSDAEPDAPGSAARKPDTASAAPQNPASTVANGAETGHSGGDQHSVPRPRG